MKKIIIGIVATIILLSIPTSCAFVKSEMIEDAYRIVKKVVFTQDSVEIHLKEKEVYFEFVVGQEIDTTLKDGTGVWLKFDRARNTYLVSITEPSTQFKIKKK